MKTYLGKKLVKIFNRRGYRIVPIQQMPEADLHGFFTNLSGRGFQPKNILDVGANRAHWSMAARKVFPDAAYTLIEPQKEMAPYLDQFCTDTPNARWINAGAGSSMGELELTICPDTVSTSFAHSEEEAMLRGLQRRRVPVVTLDHVVDSVIHQVPEMVKLDVEGFEHEVLKGSASLIGKTEVFLLELCMFEPRTGARSFHEMIQIMADFGYRAYDFTMFLPRPHDGAVGLVEMAFAREKGLLRAFGGW